MDSLKKLRYKADKVFSEYVRKRDADKDGYVNCCTCGKSDHWKNMDCGHYLSRSYLSVRYEEKNTGPQCYSCNRLMDGQQLKFEIYLVKKYGKEAVEELEHKSRMTIKDQRSFLMEIINRYKS